MANLFAIHSVGDSLITYLRNAYEALEQLEKPSCSFSVLSSGQFGNNDEDNTLLSLYLYRVTMNEHLRNVTPRHRPLSQDVPLSLDLHYLLTVWTESARDEHFLLAWAMREIYMNPTLNASSLTAIANWEQQDIIQLIPAELSNEDMMRVWDALEPAYHLSASYIARVVRIDADTSPDARPVVVQRFDFTDREPAMAPGGAVP